MRLPLAQDIDSRDGTSNRDERLTNVLGEDNNGQQMATLRPGLVLDVQASGVGNGLVVFNGELVSVFGSTIKRLIVGTPFAVVTDLFYLSLDGSLSDSLGSTVYLNSFGTPQFSAGQVQCGSESYFSTSEIPDLVVVDTADSYRLAVGTADFTIEGWYYPTGTVAGYVFSRTDQVENWIELVIDSATSISVNVSDATSATANTTSVSSLASKWTHIALVRTAGDFVLYVDGVESDRFTDWGLDVIDVPTDFDTTCCSGTGYWSQIRFAQGAKYTGRFYPSCGLNNADHFENDGTVTSSYYDFCASPL